MNQKPVLPLYRSVPADLIANVPPRANFGLVYNKLPNRCNRGFLEFDKESWLEAFVDTVRCAFENPCLDETLFRLETLAAVSGGKAFELTTATRLVTGMGLAHPMENGFSWHHTLGVPYIPGTTLKGLARSWVEQWLSDRAEVLHAFGSDALDSTVGDGHPKQAGELIFLDALPTSLPKLDIEYMTPHYGPYYQGNEPPADWHSPVPIPFLTVAPGTTFKFFVLSRSHDRRMVQKGVRWLAEALTTIGVGAKSSAGLGLFRSWNPANPPWEFPAQNEVWSNCRLERKLHRGMVSLLVTLPDGRQLTVDHRVWQPRENQLEPSLREALKGGRLRAKVTVQVGSELKFIDIGDYTVSDE